MRVLIGLREVSGFCVGLKRGFDDIGVPCTLLNLGGDPLEKPERLFRQIARTLRLKTICKQTGYQGFGQSRRW